MGETKQQKSATSKSRTGKKTATAARIKYKKWQHKIKRDNSDPRAKAATTPKKPTNWLKKEVSRKRPRTPKKSPGEIFAQCSKQVALKKKPRYST